MSPLSDFLSTDLLTLLVDDKYSAAFDVFRVEHISLSYWNIAIVLTKIFLNHFNKCQNDFSLILDTQELANGSLSYKYGTG